MDADLALLRAVNAWHAPAADTAAALLSNDAQLFVVPLAAGYAATGSWGTPVRVLEADVVGSVLCVGLKYAVDRQRPFQAHPDLRLPVGPEPLGSFPSGHATVAFAGAATIAFEQPAMAIPAFLWAGAVGYSRLYNGVHYPSDVLAGAALGVGSAFLTRALVPGLNARLGVPTPMTFSATF